MPDVTVVIPTRDRWDVLVRTLELLARQDLGGIEAEVVVVDNGSRTPAPELAGARLAVEPRPGAAAARNRGVAAARGRLVLFVGDDCLPADDALVRGHVEAHAGDGPPRAVTGRIEWDPAVERTEAMDWLERAGHMVDMERLRREPPGPETFYTGNVSLPRRTLLDAAGFDERFSGYGYEDLELALRLADRGVRFEHAPHLGVLHSHSYGMEQSLRRMEAVGRGGRLLHAIYDQRRPPPGPPASRARLAAGLALARVGFLGREPPPAAPRAVRNAWMRAAHLGAFARGYAAAPLDDHPAGRGYGRFPLDSRPPVSVVVPFLGSAREGQALLAALAGLRLGEGDEVIVADNGGTLAEGAAPVRVVPALDERSSYYARNAGADAARNDWLLFLDADCLPPAGLLDDYFREPFGEGCAIVAGGVVAARGQRALVARYAAARRHLSQAAHVRDVHRPYGITANLLVRREAWEAVGGFFEGLRSGGDQDLCWRIQDAGWTLEYREAAAVEHRHRERVLPMMRQMARYSAAIAWMGRRKPGSSPRPRVAGRLARVGAGTIAWLALGRAERAAFKGLDGCVVVAEGAGWLASNDAPAAGAASRDPAPRALVVGDFPTVASSGLAHALAGRGPLLIEARRRPDRPAREAAHGLRARYAEDDGVLRRALAITSLRGRGTGADLSAPPGVGELWECAAAARRLRRAGATEIHGDPASRRRAALIAAISGIPLAGAHELSEQRPSPARA